MNRMRRNIVTTLLLGAFCETGCHQQTEPTGQQALPTVRVRVQMIEATRT
jgi:hypothetical protein